MTWDFKEEILFPPGKIIKGPDWSTWNRTWNTGFIHQATVEWKYRMAQGFKDKCRIWSQRGGDINLPKVGNRMMEEGN